MTVIWIVPPYTKTDLDTHSRGNEKAQDENPLPPMPLQEYMKTATAILEKGSTKEVARDFAKTGTKPRGMFLFPLWRFLDFLAGLRNQGESCM